MRHAARTESASGAGTSKSSVGIVTALLAVIVLAQAPVALADMHGFSVKFSPRHGFEVKKDGTTISYASRFLCADPPWKNFWFIATKDSPTVKKLDDGFEIKTDPKNPTTFDVESWKLTVLSKTTYRIAIKGKLTKDVPAVIDHIPLALPPELLAGAKVDFDGTTVDMADYADKTMPRSKEFTTCTIHGQKLNITFKVVKGVKYVLIDRRIKPILGQKCFQLYPAHPPHPKKDQAFEEEIEITVTPKGEEPTTTTAPAKNDSDPATEPSADVKSDAKSGGLVTRPAAVGSTLNILYIGNSYTAYNDLTDVIAEMAKTGEAHSTIKTTQVVFGGKTLRDHWETYKTAQWLKVAQLKPDEQKKLCDDLEAAWEKDKTNQRLHGAYISQRKLLSLLNRGKQPKWDYVVLQAYRDTQGDTMDSLYAEYARKFAKLAQAQGAGVVLYATTVAGLNAKPLDKAPTADAVKARTNFYAALSRELGALVVPVFYGVNECQRANKSIPLRWVHSTHPNQAGTYLTALMFYATLFDKNPAGLTVDKVCYKKVRGKDTDPDGNPRCVTFSKDQQAFFQKIAWKAVRDFQAQAAKN